jgi:hypothetical protein
MDSKMNERINELLKQSRTEYWTQYTPSYDYEKFAELIVADYARKTIQGLMSDPAFVQAMDEYYENKWSHRFD